MVRRALFSFLTESWGYSGGKGYEQFLGNFRPGMIDYPGVMKISVGNRNFGEAKCKRRPAKRCDVKKGVM